MALLVLILLLVGMGVALVAAGILALGSLFAHLFAVTTFEASLVVLGVALLWAIWARPTSQVAGDQHGEDGDVLDAEPAFILQALPMPARPRTRRRKR